MDILNNYAKDNNDDDDDDRNNKILQQHFLHTIYSVYNAYMETLYKEGVSLLKKFSKNVLSCILQRVPLTLNITIAMAAYIAAALASSLQIIHTSGSTTTNFYFHKVNISITSTIATRSNATATYSEAILLFDNQSKAYCVDNASFAINEELLQDASANVTNSTVSSYSRENYRGLYDVSYIARTNPFWLQFEPPSDELFFIMGLIYCIISSVGAVGNALVIFMFIRCKSLRTPANKLVINLAISDLIMLLKCPIAAYNNFKRGPALGELACRIYGFLGGLSGTASIGTLTAIALDRYNVVVHPLDPLRYTSKLRTQISIMIIWSYSCFFSIIPALDVGLSIYVPEGFLTTCSFDYLSRDTSARIFMFTFFIAAWCIPLIIICSSYFYILRVVFAANRIQSNRDKNKTEQKLAIIVFVIIGLWFAAWTPYSIVAMLGVFGQEQYLTPIGSMIPALFCKTAACIDPYVYAATHPRFRMEFRRLIYGKDHVRRSSTIRSSFLTRSSTTRRLRTNSEMCSHTNDIPERINNLNLSVVPELKEVNDDCIKVVHSDVATHIEQSQL
uniref:G-protein coupled receptors family 1 profile domain-containing protein n=1 Tax=Glossina brevipalpis TaxID=37001 RepID=A0A1A9WEB5_9MUSC